MGKSLDKRLFDDNELPDIEVTFEFKSVVTLESWELTDNAVVPNTWINIDGDIIAEKKDLVEFLSTPDGKKAIIEYAKDSLEDDDNYNKDVRPIGKAKIRIPSLGWNFSE